MGESAHRGPFLPTDFVWVRNLPMRGQELEYMKASFSGGGRREINVTCPNCGHHSQIPPSAIARNNFFCSGCGKPLDLSQVFRQLASGEGTSTTIGNRDRGTSRYKSARKGRR